MKSTEKKNSAPMSEEDFFSVRMLALGIKEKYSKAGEKMARDFVSFVLDKRLERGTLEGLYLPLLLCEFLEKREKEDADTCDC